MIGPNGAGKSTLINLLSGELLRQCRHASCSATPTSPAWRRTSAPAPGSAAPYQKTTIFPRFTRPRKRPARRAGALARAAADVRRRRAPMPRCSDAPSMRSPRPGLTGRETIVANVLSHGEQRQLEIAMVLATDPTIILLDEPLAGMGPGRGARHHRADRLAASERHAVLIVEHDMDAVFELADRLTVMHDGQVIASAVCRQRCGAIRRCARPIWVPTETPHERAAAGRAARGVLRRQPDPARHRSVRGARRTDRADRPQRHGQDHAAARADGPGAGLPRPAQLHGHDIAGAPPEAIARRGVALVPEGRGVFGALSVVENLVMAARPGRDGRADLDAAADLRAVSAAGRAPRATAVINSPAASSRC